MTRFGALEREYALSGGNSETLGGISDESRKFRECCRYLRGKRVWVATFYDVVNVSKATFWTILGTVHDHL